MFMKKAILTAAISAASFGLAAPTAAAPISVGDGLKFVSSQGTLGGGLFSLDLLGSGGAVDVETFCLQMSQYINYTDTFTVRSITDFADDLPASDPISLETAWIFSSFFHGNLVGEFESDAIQAAIWFLEGEWASHVDGSALLISQAEAAVAAGWTNDGVRVLNLWLGDRRAQDQVFFDETRAVSGTSTPEPATLLLFGSGLAATAVWLMRRRR